MIRYAVLFMLMASTVGWAYSGVSPTPTTGGLSRLGFLDSSRFSISNSMYVGYASNGRYQESGGALMTTLGYTFSPRLTFRATLSKEFTFLGQGPSDEGISLSGFELDWTPFKHLFVRVEFSSPPLHAFADPYAMTWR